MSTLTKIVSLAKKLKKEAPNKFAKWTDYIKEASKKIKPVVKKAKKVAKKVTKKVKKKLGETHTDKNSHNVKLNIYSGAGLRKDENTLSYAKPVSKKTKTKLLTDNIIELNSRIKDDEIFYMFIDDLNFQLKNKFISLQQKNKIKKQILWAKKQQLANRKILNILKKAI
jgi:hypothetical protein